MSGDVYRLSCVMALSHGSFVKLLELNNVQLKLSWSSHKKPDGLITVTLDGRGLTEPEISVFMTEMVDFLGKISQLKIDKGWGEP